MRPDRSQAGKFAGINALLRGLALGVWVGFLLPQGLRAELPIVELRERWEVDPLERGISSVFFGRSGEGSYLFKLDGRSLAVSKESPRVLGTYGNLEGELLATRILQAMGVLTPTTDVVGVKGLEGRYLRAVYMGKDWPQEGTLFKGSAKVPDQALIDLAALRRLQILDLWIGNADRHEENLWFYQKKGARSLVPVAFDHSFAFGDKELSPDWSNGAAFSLPISVPANSRGAFPSSSSREILYRNPLYRGALAYPIGVIRYFEEAARIQHLFPDAALGDLVASIPRQAFGAGNPLVRRTELHNGLKRRREGLFDVLEGTLRNSIPGLVGALVLDGLPPFLRSQLPEDRTARTSLELRIGGRRGFDPVRIARALAEAPIPAEAQAKMLAFLTRQAGHPGPIPPTPPEGSGGRTQEPRPLVAAGLLRSYALPISAYPPTEWMLAREPGKRLRGVAGARTPEQDNPVHQVMREAVERLKPRAEQYLRVLYLPGSPGHYHGFLQDPDGSIPGEVFLDVSPIEDLASKSGFRVTELDKHAAPPWDQLIRPFPDRSSGGVKKP